MSSCISFRRIFSNRPLKSGWWWRVFRSYLCYYTTCSISFFAITFNLFVSFVTRFYAVASIKAFFRLKVLSSFNWFLICVIQNTHLILLLKWQQNRGSHKYNFIHISFLLLNITQSQNNIRKIHEGNKYAGYWGLKI